MSKSQKAVVLFSSGLDSTVNLYEAHKKLKIERVLTFNYGQRAAEKEIEFSKRVCEELNLKQEIIELPWFRNFTQTSLVNLKQEIPKGESVDIEDQKASEKTAASVWVPNRNGIFLNIAAGFAEGLGAEYVVVGFNKEEAQTFPDNSEEYLKSTNHSFSFSTSRKVQVICYTIGDFKTEIYKRAQGLGVNFKNIWPCYFSKEEICGECESCLRYLRAQRSAQ